MSELYNLHLLAGLLERGHHKLACDVSDFPLGLWVDPGIEVLFDGHYFPLWQFQNGKVTVVDPRHFDDRLWERQIILFDDGTPPYFQYDAMKRLRSILVRWGLIEPPYERGRAWRDYQARRRERLRRSAD